MNSLWQHLTLSSFPLRSWWNASFVHRLVGPLRQWRRSSRLLRHADLLGAILVSVVFGLGPFLPNAIIGLLLAACGIYWLLLTLSDPAADAGEWTAKSEEARSPDGDAPPLTTPIHVLVLLYWGVVTIATAFSPVKAAAFVGWQKLTLYLLFFALMARVLRFPKLRNLVIASYLLAALAVSVYGLQQWFSGTAALATWVDPTSPLSKTTRVYSYLGNPNLLAAYLIPAVIFSIMALFTWQRWLPRLLALVMVGVNATCLVMTFSRGGWIGIVVALFVTVLLLAYWWSIYLPRFWRTLALPLMVGGFVGAMAIAVVAVPTLRDRASSIFVGRGDSSNNYRINVWMSVIQMIKDHPLLGIGPGNVAFNKIYPLYQRPRFSALSAYSIVLEVAVEAGLIGLTCFLWLLLVIFTQGLSQLAKLRKIGDRQGFWLIGAISTLLGMLGHGLFDTVLYRPEASTLWWMMIALVASYYTYPSTPQYAKEYELKD
jgi:putative inorganic carbon (HCO3(-)) transporter